MMGQDSTSVFPTSPTSYVLTNFPSLFNKFFGYVSPDSSGMIGNSPEVLNFYTYAD